MEIPHNKDAERSIIASITMTPHYWELARGLTPDHFLAEDAREAFGQIREMSENGRSWLEGDHDVSGWLLMGRTVMTHVQFEEQISRVEEAYTCRVGFLQAQKLAKASLRLDANQVEAIASEVKLPARGSEGVSVAKIAVDLYDKIGQGMVDVVEIGMSRLDRHGIVKRKEGFVLAARPSMGKSQLAFQWADHVASSGGVVVIWSGEMDRENCVERMAGARSGISIREAKTEDEINRVSHSLARLAGLENLIVYDQPMTSVDLWGQCRKVRDQFGRIDLVIVDHIRLMTDHNEAERHRLGSITRNLREIAKEMGCAMVMCVQLNRAPENRENKRPGLGDLRDSGEIEENADVVSFIYRDAYYEGRENGGSQSGPVEVYAKKNRNGKMWGGSVLYFDEDRGPRFVELDGRGG